MSTETSPYKQSTANRQPAVDEEHDQPPEREVDPLSKDDMFHLLSNQRRRDTLRYLADNGGRVDMRDLAEQVAAWEHDTTVTQLDSDERQRVYIALYQTHLPKLDDHGIIAYNQSRGIVERTERADQLDPYLRRSEDEGGRGRGRERGRGEEPTSDGPVGRSDTTYGLVVCLTGLAVLAVGWLGLLPAFPLLVATWTIMALAAVAGLDRDIASRAER